MFRRILRDATEDREPTLDGGVDGHQIAGLHVREDALPRGRKGYQVSSDVTFHTQRQIEEGLPSARPRPQTCERRLQLRRTGGELAIEIQR